MQASSEDIILHVTSLVRKDLYESGDLIEEQEKVRTDSFQHWRNYEILVSSFAIVNIRKELHEPNESGGDVSGTQCMNSTLFQKINPTLQLCLSTRTNPRTRPETHVLRIALRSVLAASCSHKCTRPQHTLTNSLPPSPPTSGDAPKHTILPTQPNPEPRSPSARITIQCNETNRRELHLLPIS